MIASFEVPGPVIGKGRPRAFRMGGGVRMHTPEKTARYENLVALCAKQAMGSRSPVDGPLALSLKLYFEPPASWSGKKRGAALNGEIRPTVKPDLDNVLKAVADACNGIVYLDDKQIVEVSVSKHYSPAPSAFVTVVRTDGRYAEQGTHGGTQK